MWKYLLKFTTPLLVLVLLLPVGGCKHDPGVSEASGTVQVPSKGEVTHPIPTQQKTVQVPPEPKATCPTEGKRCVPKAIATISVVGNPEDVAANSRTGHVYVIDGTRHVSVFQEDEHLAALPMKHNAISSLAVDEERNWVYVTNAYEDSIVVIRGTEVITTLETVGREPTDVAVEPESGWAYVVSGYRKLPPFGEPPIVEGNVTVISGDRVVGVVPLGDVVARHVVADPVNGYVYVGCVKGDVVVLKGMEEVARFNVGSTATAMDVDPRTGEVYVLYSAPGDRSLSQFRRGELIATIGVESKGGAPRNLRVHPVTGDVYVVDFTRQKVIVVRDMEVIAQVPVGWSPLKMAIDPLTGNVYVANFMDDTVTVIHGTEVLATIDVGWYPYGIGVNPANGWVYVSNTNDHTVTVLGFRKEEGRRVFLPIVLKGHSASLAQSKASVV